MKVDLDRLAAVRGAVGDRVTIAVDGTAPRRDLPTCKRFCAVAECSTSFGSRSRCGYDDVAGHAALARATSIPIALGEQLYSADAFNSFLNAGAVDFVQPDVTRRSPNTSSTRPTPSGCLSSPMSATWARSTSISRFGIRRRRRWTYIPWIKDSFVEPIRATHAVRKRRARIDADRRGDRALRQEYRGGGSEPGSASGCGRPTFRKHGGPRAGPGPRPVGAQTEIPRGSLRAGNFSVALKASYFFWSRAFRAAPRMRRSEAPELGGAVSGDRLLLLGDFERLDRDGDLAGAAVELDDARVDLLSPTRSARGAGRRGPAPAHCA